MARGSTRRWRKLRRQVLERDGWVCRLQLANGRCTGRGDQAHHLVPVARGGQDDLENLVAACKPCNLAVGDRLPDELPPGFFSGTRTPLPPRAVVSPGQVRTTRTDH